MQLQIRWTVSQSFYTFWWVFCLTLIFLVLASYPIQKPVMVIRFSMKFSLCFQNWSFKFHVEASFPNSYFNSNSKLRFCVLIWIWIHSYVSDFFFRIWIQSAFSTFVFKWEVVKQACYPSKILEMNSRIPVRTRIRKSRFEFDFE